MEQYTGIMTEIDFSLGGYGSAAILTPRSAAARAWAADWLPAEVLVYGGGVVIEPRLVDAIIDGIREAGLTVYAA